MAEDSINVDAIEALYVQNATSMSYRDGKLTLHGLAPTTLYFSDRPDRVAGHCSTPEFVASWDQGPESFASDPPNAALSIFHEDGVSDVVVELMDPKLHGSTLSYTVLHDGRDHADRARAAPGAHGVRLRRRRPRQRRKRHALL